LTLVLGFDVLLPFTFSVESKQTHDRHARQGMILQSKISSPATFLGFMATVSAHRAILYGMHGDLAPSDTNHDELITDPVYKKVKHEAIVAVRRIVENQEGLTQHAVDACFGLVSTATVVGNFEEAKMHLKGIAQVLPLLGNTPESMMWLPLASIKVSVGLLGRPVMDLPWTREPIPQEMLQHISATPDAEMARLGSDFQALEELSQELRGLLEAIKDICNFCELGAVIPQGLSSLENQTLRQKSLETEFDLLAYPFDIPAFSPPGDRKEPVLPALERVVRLAALGFLSRTPHVVMPSSGLGRALTRYQQDAVTAWLLLLEKGAVSDGVDQLKVVTWALFLFAQGSHRQPEQEYFIDLLARFTRELGLRSWSDVERAMFGFLYVPELQSPVWQSIWDMAASSFPDPC
jgi:hypothetical protein